MKPINLPFILLCCCLYLVCPQFTQADSVDRTYRKASNQFYRLYRPGKFRSYAENWEKTIAAFSVIVKKHPAHRRAPQALYNMGKLYHSLYKWNHNQTYLNRAVQKYRQLAHNYPTSKIADDAQFQIGLIFEEYKHKPRLAYLEYQKVIQLFPSGDFAPSARKKLAHLPKPTKQQLRAASTHTRPLALPGPKVNSKTSAQAITPEDLTTARYGGLSEAKAKAKTTKSLLEKVEYWSTEDWSRIVIDIADPVRFKYQVLAADKKHRKGPRMYLDLPTTYLPKKFKRRIAANDGLIKQARIAQFNPNTVRVVLDLASLDKIKVYPFSTPKQYKVIIDILGNVSPTQNRIHQTPSNEGPVHGIAPGAAGTPKITLSEAFGLKVKRIIIDPGHGGRDPGASGFKQQEKNLALKLAKQLRTLIRSKNPTVDVLMTRETDKYIPLEARTAFANKHRGDLFISIHLNASRKASVSGIETYYLNLTSDSYALTLAATENQTSLKSISDLQGLLHDLMTHSKIQESTELAHLVQNQTVKMARSTHLIHLRNLGVKKAPFFVLLGSQMPSILIEAGFITNRKENKLLRTARYRKTLAKGIYQGIYRYMDRM